MNVNRFEFRNVSRTYGRVTALNGVSFVLESGRHTVVLGPSGCGKSTALRLLAGLEPPSAGEVLLDGRLISSAGRISLPPHRRGLAMVFQDLGLWPNLTAWGNVRLGLSGTSLSRSQRRARIEESLSLCSIADLAARKPGQLSGGQQQRVALARALAVHPRFLLLDEPFAGLDLVTKTQLLREIARLAKAQDVTLILVTHDPFEAITLCSHALVLDDGRVVAQGALEEVIRTRDSALLSTFRAHVNDWAARSEPPTSDEMGPQS